MMTRPWTAVGAICLVAITASAPATAKYETIKRIGVISAIGDAFAVQKIGFTVFGNERKEFATESWKIDEFVVGKVRAALAGRFDVRAVSYPKAAFLPSGGNIFTGPQINVADAVRRVSPQGLDAYLIVTKWSSPFGTTNQSVSGLGIIDSSGLVTNVEVFTLYAISVIDGHQFTSLGIAFPPQAGHFVTIHGPSREVDKSWLPVSLDARANGKLKGAVTELLAQSLPATLQKLELTK
jgi:hypothetical protein